MRETSGDADLIFASMPVPDMQVNPFDYLAWLVCYLAGGAVCLAGDGLSGPLG